MRWKAFRLTARKGRAALEAAATPGTKLGSVYQAESSVTQTLEHAARKLDGGSDPEVLG
jgi:hypothetical protein